MNTSNVLILNTGGTLNCIKTELGYQPMSGMMTSMLSKISMLSHPEMPHYDIQDYSPLIDSSNISLAIWNQLAFDIQKSYHDYDGFVIFHGTDTMAYTASALSFMLENLHKPVILTGSQIPLTAVRNDAIDNVVTAIWLAGQSSLNEVYIYFNQHLLRGNRTQKISSVSLKAFDSPNVPPIAIASIDMTLPTITSLEHPPSAFRIQPLKQHRITSFRLFPGCAFDVLHTLCELHLDAIILETYGAGNAPGLDELITPLKKAAQTGTFIINQSQCLHGTVRMGQYETSYALKKAGLLSACDMTPEAVYCKLLYLLSKYHDPHEIRYYFEKNLIGELTENAL